MSEHNLTPLEEEFLLDLAVVHEQFQASQIPAGTIRSKVMYRMAHRRGKTRPAPVHGLAETDRTFKATFTRVINRLLKRGLIQRRAVGLGDFHGLPYQWGYGRHGKRDQDIFMTETGLALAAELQAKRSQEEQLAAKAPPSTKLATPQPQAPTAPSTVPLAPLGAPLTRPQSRLLYSYAPTPGIQYHVVLPADVPGPPPLLYRHAVQMGGFEVVYEVSGKAKKVLPTRSGQ